MLSIIKTVLLVEKESRCSLIYGNRNSHAIMYKRELEVLVNKHPDRLQNVLVIDEPEADWSGITGILSEEKILKLISTLPTDIRSREYFICGPTGMMDEAKRALNKLQISEQNMHIEFFTQPAPKEKEPSAPDPTPGAAKVTVVLDGKEHELDIRDRNTTILRAGIQAGLDPPYSCEAGVCSTCIAKLIEGTVTMDENNILTEDEVSKGYILTCQSHPTSPIVKVEYMD